ncbi:hypothetical protein niasHT_038186 [Heterodera trifolii]|uniref:Large ribosomal subunit protein mL64 n=1 Tax=Heterodera trifolii TaxID=157864 RepID=A0ABD2IRI4_9BILA
MEPSLLRYFCPRQFRLFAATSFCTLSPRHRIIAEGGMPPLEYEFEREKWAMGERFGRYGLRGGVDISKLWPTVEEIEEVKAVRRFRTAKEAQHIAKMETEKEQIRRKNRLDRIERNWATYDAQLAEFNQREVQTEAEKETADQELKRQVEEVRNYFGYWVDPNDPRFSVMLKHREDTLKMEAKMAVKKKKKYGQVTTVSSAEQAEMKLVQGDEMKKKAEEGQGKGGEWKQNGGKGRRGREGRSSEGRGEKKQNGGRGRKGGAKRSKTEEEEEKEEQRREG